MIIFIVNPVASHNILYRLCRNFMAGIDEFLYALVSESGKRVQKGI